MKITVERGSELYERVLNTPLPGLLLRIVETQQPGGWRTYELNRFVIRTDVDMMDIFWDRAWWEVGGDEIFEDAPEEADQASESVVQRVPGSVAPPGARSDGPESAGG